jgi:hypothetical protein
MANKIVPQQRFTALCTPQQWVAYLQRTMREYGEKSKYVVRDNGDLFIYTPEETILAWDPEKGWVELVVK